MMGTAKKRPTRAVRGLKRCAGHQENRAKRMQWQERGKKNARSQKLRPDAVGWPAYTDKRRGVLLWQ